MIRQLAEIQPTVKAIQDFFEVEGDLSDKDIDTLHTQFVQYIDAANERLRKCDSLLRKGLRGEAIQEAEQELNLFEFVAELDIAEWDDWKKYVVKSGFPPQPELLVDVAAELNEAYTQNEPLERLLRKHRVFALARCRLSERIQILRSIAKKDSGNAVWLSDLKDYEKARFSQIDKELRQFWNEKDFRAIKDLYREVTDDTWLAPIPETLVESVKDKYGKLIASNSLDRLIDLEKQINAAFSDFSLDRAIQYREEWDRFEKLAGGRRKDELVDLVQPAFEWIDDELQQAEEEETKQKAFADLEQALNDQTTDKAELQRFMNVVQRYDEPLQDRIQVRYEERLRTIAIREKRKFVALAVSLAMTILVLGAITAGIIVWQMNRSEIRRTSTSFENLLNQKQLEQARSYLQKLETDQPSVASDAVFEPLRTRLGQMTEEESQRVAAFKGFLATARKQGVESPTWQGFEIATNDLKEAEAINSSDAEKVEIKQIQREILAKKNEFQTKEDQEFRSAAKLLLDSAEDKIAGLGIEGIDRKLEEIETIKDKFPRVSPETMRASMIDGLIKKLHDNKATAQLQSVQQQLDNRLKQSVGSSASYAGILKEYSTKIVSTRASDFATVLKDKQLDFLDRIGAWNQLAAKWNDPSVSPVDRISVLEEVKNGFSTLPGADKIVASLPQLESLSLRDPNKLVEALRTQFNHRSYKLNHAIDETAKTYYFVGDPEPSDDYLKIDYLVDISDMSKTKKSNNLRLDNLRTVDPNSPGDAGGKYAMAPHGKFVEAAREYLSRPEDSFENKMCSLLDGLVNDKTGIDSVEKMKLLQSIIKIARDGSETLEQELSDFNSSISGETGAIRANYWDPDDINSRKLRARYSQIIGSLPSPMEIYRTKIEGKDLGVDAIENMAHMAWLGIPLKENNDWQTVFVDNNPQPDGDVFVSQGDELINVGSYISGKLKLQNSAGLVEGTPLILMFNQ